MAPRVGPLEIGDPGKKHPGREPSEFPEVESSTETRSQAAQVASFRTKNFSLSVPAVVIAALISAGGAWLMKPSQTVALSESDRLALQDCRDLKAQVGRIELKQENFQNWIEPQIGVILVQLNARAYAPPPQNTKP